MTLLILGALVFFSWLIGRRALRIMALLAILWFVGVSALEGYQDASARAEAGP